KVVVPVTAFGLKPGDRITGISLSQAGGIVLWDAATISGKLNPAQDPGESLAAWRALMGTAAPPEVPIDVAALVRKGPKATLTAAELDKVRRFYLTLIARPASPDLAAARAAWESAHTARVVAEEAAPGSFIFKDRDKPADAFVMLRGQY